MIPFFFNPQCFIFMASLKKGQGRSKELTPPQKEGGLPFKC